MEIERTYGVTTQIEFPLIKAGMQDYNTDPPVFQAGDVRLHTYDAETGAPNLADSTNLPVHVEKGVFRLVLTAGEMSHKRIGVAIVDTATKTWEDQYLEIVTRGHASAQYNDPATVAAAVGSLVCETEGGYTLKQIQSIVLAVLAGVTGNSGGTLKTPNGLQTRVVATLNASDERTGMALTPSA